MGIPQIIIIVLYSLSLGIAMVKHGEPMTGRHSFPLSLCSVAALMALLWWGGFFG